LLQYDGLDAVALSLARQRRVECKDPLGVQSSERGPIMPNDSHQRAAEFHELAAHAHRTAAAHHGKEDHQTGHEHSKQAMEYANKAMEWTQESHQRSKKVAGNT